MASLNNPNTPRKQRKKAGRQKVQKQRAASKVTKNPRGTARSNVLHPTSGPSAPLSGKKARKVEKAKNHARQRALEKAMEEQGEVAMTDAPKTTKPKAQKAADDDQMEVDAIA